MKAFIGQIATLVEGEVQFVVIGGVAAGLHGAGRATFDLDICYDPSAENRERLAKALAGWGAYLRGVERGLPFTMDARQLLITPVMTLTTSTGDLDVMDRVAGVGEFAAVYAQSVVDPSGGRGVPDSRSPGIGRRKACQRTPEGPRSVAGAGSAACDEKEQSVAGRTAQPLSRQVNPGRAEVVVLRRPPAGADPPITPPAASSAA